jgi:hypothetical protein
MEKGSGSEEVVGSGAGGGDARAGGMGGGGPGELVDGVEQLGRSLEDHGVA